jgi:hypothetical protein
MKNYVLLMVIIVVHWKILVDLDNENVEQDFLMEFFDDDHYEHERIEYVVD